MSHKPRKFDQVVAGAIAEFQEFGYALACVDGIAKRANVSKRTLYNYFDSKDKLFAEIVRKTVTLFSVSEETEFDHDADPSDELYAFTLRHTTPYRDPCAVKLGRLILGEWLRDPSRLNEFATLFEAASEPQKLFDYAARRNNKGPEYGEAVSKDILGFISGRRLLPSLLSGRPISQEEQENLAQKVVALFAPSFSPRARHLE